MPSHQRIRRRSRLRSAGRGLRSVIGLVVPVFLCVLLVALALASRRRPDRTEELRAARADLARGAANVAEIRARRVLSVHEDDPTAWMLLAEALGEQGRQREQIAALARASALAPAWPVPAVVLAARDLSRGSARRARDRLDRCLGGRDGPAPAHRLRSRARLALRDVRGSIDDLEAAARADPSGGRDLLEAASRMRWCAVRSMSHEDAARAAKLARHASIAGLAAGPAGSGIEAAALLLRGRIDDAKSAVGYGGRSDPGATVRLLLAEALGRSGHAAEGAREVRAAVETAEGVAEFAARIGAGGSSAPGVLLALAAPSSSPRLVDAVARRDVDAAEIITALAARGRSAPANLALAHDLLCHGAWERDDIGSLLDTAARAIECSPHDLRGPLWRARGLGRLDDRPALEGLLASRAGAALTDAERDALRVEYLIGAGRPAAALAPMTSLLQASDQGTVSWRAGTSLARSLFRHGGAPATRRVFTALCEAAPESPLAPYVLGRLTEDDAPTAAAYYRAALDRDPDFVPALNDLAWSLSTKLAQPDEALVHAVAARDAAPTDPRVGDTLGAVLRGTGDHARAAEIVAEAARRRPWAARHTRNGADR